MPRVSFNPQPLKSNPMKNPLTLITKFPATRREREFFIHQSVEEIMNGNYYPLQIEVRLKNLEEIIKGIRASTTVKNAVVDEASRHHEKTFELYGARITKSNRREWFYDDCNDSILSDFRIQLTALQTATRRA